MNIASVISPFENAEETPWIIWKGQERVSSLPEQKQGNECLAHELVNKHELPPIPPAPPIHRMQYNTVMNRIVQASKHTGSYSAWTP